MAFSFTTAKKILLPPDPFEARDLYAAWKTWARDHLNLTRALRPTGNEDRGGGLYSGSSFFVASDWQMVPHDSDHTLVIRGDLIPETDNSGRIDLFQPRAGRTIIIRQEMSSLIQTVAVGSGVTAQDKTDIASASAIASRDAILSDATRIAGARIDAAISSRAAPGEGLTAGEKLVLESNATLLAAVNSMLAELHRRQGLDAANPVTLDDPGGRITATGINIEVTTVAGVTTMTRQA